MKLVLIGIQGSGKSTQGNLLSTQLKVPYLSTGHIFREIAKEKTQSGRFIKETINAGILIPDEKTIDIVNEYISRSEYKNGYILDGFPRTIVQAKNFKNNIDKVIYLKILDKEALWRIAHRGDATRADESLPALKKRIELFHKFTKPVLDYYEKEGKLAVVDGTQEIGNVNKDILLNLGKQIIKNQVHTWEKKQKILLAVVGLPGAGKSAAAEFFKEKGLPIIEFGKIINDYINSHHLEHNEENHKKIRESLRVKHGQWAFAILNLEKIQKSFEKNMIVVVDGMRSWEEYIYLKDTLKNVKIILLALYADKEIRYRRIAKRGFRSALFGKQRDLDELININMAPTLGFADYFIDANSSLLDLRDKLEVCYRVIYYS